MKHYVLTLSETSDPGTGINLPVVPGSDLTVDEAPGWYTAHGPLVPGINTKWTRHARAFLQKQSPGLYLVYAENEAMAQINKLGIGKTLKQLGPDWHTYEVEGTEPDPEKPGNTRPVKRVMKIDNVPTLPASDVTPWNDNGVRIVKATPTVSSTVGGYDMKTIIETIVGIATPEIRGRNVR